VYFRPDLTTESDLTRLVRHLLRELRRRVIPTVVTATSTDFDSEPGVTPDVTEIATLPSLVLVGPDISENKFRRGYGKDDGDVLLAPRWTVDVGFTLTGTTEGKVANLNLAGLVGRFFNRMKYVELVKDPALPAAGVVRYPLRVVDPIRVTTVIPNDSNVHGFSTSFAVEGVELDEGSVLEVWPEVLETVLTTGRV